MYEDSSSVVEGSGNSSRSCLPISTSKRSLRRNGLTSRVALHCSWSHRHLRMSHSSFFLLPLMSICFLFCSVCTLPLVLMGVPQQSLWAPTLCSYLQCFPASLCLHGVYFHWATHLSHIWSLHFKVLLVPFLFFALALTSLATANAVGQGLFNTFRKCF
jgi:hypothetical protein